MKKHLFLAGAGLMCGLTVNAAAPASELPCRWERLNLDGGGYIGRIVTDPSRAGRVYCLSDKGGIHRSDDGGKSWVMKNRGFFRETHYGVSDLVIDPKNPDRLVAAVGNAPWAWKFHYPGAVMVSSDGGESWKERKILGFPGEGEPGKGWGNRLNFAPDGTLYAATFHQGLWKSPDAGDNWEFVGLGDKFLTNVLTDPDDANRLLVSARELPLDSNRSGGLYESRDGGKSWNRLLEQSVTSLDRAVYRADWLLANCGKEGILFSEDRGRNWRALPVRQEMTRFHQVKFQPGRKPRIWATVPGEGAHLYYTDDFGKSWIQPAADFKQALRYPSDWYMAARKWTRFSALNGVYGITFDPADPDRIFVGDFFTVWRSDDGGRHFTACPHGINTLCVYQVVVDPVDARTIYVNTADLGLFKSSDGGRTFSWPFRDDKKTGDMLINETSRLLIAGSDHRKLALTMTIDWQKPTVNGFYVSADGGRHWQEKSAGLPRQDSFLTGLVSLSRDNSELLAACGGNAKTSGNVYYTRNGGGSWEVFAPGLPQGRLFGDNWSKMPNLATDGVNIYTATDQGIFHCDRRERQWRRIGADAFKGLVIRTIEAISTAPGSLWVGTDNGLFVSRDAGKNFTRASQPGMEMCQGIAVDPKNSSRWFVAVAAPWWTSHKNIPGIYLTVDGGVNYRRLSDMPGEGMAWRLTLDPHDGNRLYVGTNGIGAWRAVIAENGSPDTAE